MSLRSRQELLSSVRERYSAAGRGEKRRVLDELIAATGYHRKYLVAQLGKRAGGPSGARKRGHDRSREYGHEIQTVLTLLWEAANRICSKRLVAFLPILIEALERHGQLSVDDETRRQLLRISAATIDRLLYPVRHKGQDRGIGTTRRGPLLKHQVPVRTFTEWDDAKPGFVEGDLVAHCGTQMAGQFLYSLVLTDIPTGWTECIALLFRDQTTILEALGIARKQFPFPLLGVDTDNGSEFINDGLIRYCRDESLTFTRSRPYKKNDQCYVEQKNGQVVRRMVGYERFEGCEACRLLGELYATLRLYINFFQPSVKLVAKTRDGAKVTRQYDRAKTPYQRVLEDESVSGEVKEGLTARYLRLDPVSLLAELRTAQDRLWHSVEETQEETTTLTLPRRAPGRGRREKVGKKVNGCQSKPVIHTDIHALDGEGRHYHAAKRRYRKSQQPRWWRTRKDPFALVTDEIDERLSRTPNASAKDILCELQQRYPDVFLDNLLRTLQRRVKVWRLAQVSVDAQNRDEEIRLNRDTATLAGQGAVPSDSAEVFDGR